MRGGGYSQFCQNFLPVSIHKIRESLITDMTNDLQMTVRLGNLSFLKRPRMLHRPLSFYAHMWEMKWFVTQRDPEHDEVIKWKHFPRYWPFVRRIHWSPVNSPYKGQWRGALMFSLICVWINGWVNNHEAGDLSRHRAHYDVIVMEFSVSPW